MKIFPEVILDFKQLEGETIKSIDVIRAEYGRTYEKYIGITCESGKRILFHGGNPYDPNPTLEEMMKTEFFTPDEIAEKVKWDESKKRRRKQDEQERKLRELERLKKELNIE
jgi:hypothetical protein